MAEKKRSAPPIPVPPPPEEDDRVVLKPVLGIKPGRYLAFLYSLALAALLFFLLVFPGLRRPGSELRIITEPEGAAVRVDGVYRDTAPCTVFADSGERAIEIVLPGFKPEVIQKKIEGRIFFSLFFPRKENISAVLTVQDSAAAFLDAAREAASWAQAGEAQSVYQIPLTLSDASYRLGPAAHGADYAAMDAVLSGAAPYTSTKAAARDYIRARFLLDSRGQSVSPAGAVLSLRAIADLFTENAGSSLALASFLDGGALMMVSDSSW